MSLTSPRLLTRSRTGLLLLLAAAVAVRIPLLWAPQIDYDEGVYWESLRAMSAGHPLFSSVYSSQPPGFLALLYPFWILGHSLTSARLGVLFFFAVCLVSVYVATRVVLGDRAALLAALVVAVDPLMLRQSLSLQADGPAVALGMLAVALALYQSPHPRPWQGWALPLLSGAALALAVSVKLLAVVFVVPVILVWYWRRRIWLGVGGVAAAGAAVMLPFLDRLSLVWHQAVAAHVDARSLAEGGWSVDMRAMLVREVVLVALGVMGGVVLVRRRADRIAVLLGAWMVLVLAVALIQRPLWPHHLLIAVPPLAMAAGALANVPVPRLVGGVLTSLAVAMLLLVGTRALDNPATADTVPTAVEALRRVTLPGDLVITDDQFAAASAGLDTPPELVDTSVVRLISQPVTAADVQRIAQAHRVRVVYLGTGRLSQLDGLIAWVEEHYPQRYDVGHQAVIHVAPEP